MFFLHTTIFLYFQQIVKCDKNLFFVEKVVDMVMGSTFTKPLILLMPLFLCGCGYLSTDPTPAFRDVQTTVAQRTAETICWNRNSDFARCHIERMLEQALTLDQLVEITLLNNRHLQASYEELGIARAHVVQAGLFKNPIVDFSLGRG